MKHLKTMIRIPGLALVALSLAAHADSAPQRMPDIGDYLTLHCDFHMHTVFSDGKVWPDIRVQEALREGLDCIALTDHLKYQKEQSRKKHPDVHGNLNRPFEIAREAAANTGLVVIRGAEVTQGMPPGHINAIFLSDADIARPDLVETLRIARQQGAFLFWNHPAWKSPDKKWEQDAIAQWFDAHTGLYEAGILRGIEVVNGTTYSREAHQWALEKNLTMFANTDIHQPIGVEFDFPNDHRTMTLVFAREKSTEGVRQALLERRTALWFGNTLIGSDEYLAPLFKECIVQDTAAYLENLAIVTLTNRCDLDFFVENESGYSLYNSAGFIELKAGAFTGLAVKTGKKLDRIDLALSVRNLHTAPDQVLNTSLSFEVDGTIPDKKVLEHLGSD